MKPRVRPPITAFLLLPIACFIQPLMPDYRYREPRPFYRLLGLRENTFYGLVFWGGGALLLVGGIVLAVLGTGGLTVGGMALALVGLLLSLFWTYIYLVGHGSQR